MHNVPPDQIEKNIKIIQLVEKYPCIYNPSISSTAGQEVVEQAWLKIAEEINDNVGSTKKKWRLLRSSLLRYLKVFKDKATSKGNSYRPYYLLKHMQFLMPFIDDKTIVKRPIKKEKPPKKDRPEEQFVLTSNSPNGITYSVTAVNATPTISTIKSPAQPESVKSEQHIQQQDIQQFYNQAHHHQTIGGVKILSENFIYEAQPATAQQLITYGVEEHQQDVDQHMEDHSSEQQQSQECMTTETIEAQPEQHIQHIQDPNTSGLVKEQQSSQITNVTTIPLPNFQNCSITSGNISPSETADLYFLIGLLPDFRIISADKKRKLKIGILNLIDEVLSK